MSVSKYRQILEKAEFAIFYFHSHRFTYVNPKFTNLMAQGSLKFIDENSRERKSCSLSQGISEMIHRLLEKELHHDELTLMRNDGSTIHLALDLILCPENGDDDCWGILMDTTPQKAWQEALQESEQRYRVILHTISDPVMIVTEKGIIETVNDAAKERFTQDAAGIMVGSHLGQIFPPAFARQRLLAIHSAIRRLESISLEESTTLEETGQIWYATKINPLLDRRGTCSKVVLVSRDITQRKIREEALRHFSRKIILTQESERRRISRELHDGLGQSLSAIRLAIGSIEKELTDNQSHIKEKCKTVMQDVVAQIEELRRIAMDLTPTILEDLGLTAAIHRLISEFSKQHSMEIKSKLIPLEGLLSPEAEINIYRMMQEILSNIGQHSKADSVSITVHIKNNKLYFIIQDDGIGFDLNAVNQARSSPEHLGGLKDLYQRSNMLKCSLVVKTKTGEGTTVIITTRILKRTNPK